ncbi:cytosol aminopeptidase-like [Cimex lectularius]|uniref:Cytosol aminopeptidase n=1 Tax=Cimex lectularius TaxID=79782 RepID=A0A8I6SRE1_CIMLE|nr:cytosol aminopeptidase-like [Cimex lectularius]XP_024085539.1 cytosol aminopeptidase-like [Cimex lectularius]XP_024085541.1 cytosol aminopeptidase-like [Cimex lectularius]
MIKVAKLLRVRGAAIKGFSRASSDCGLGSGKKGVVVGAYDGCAEGELKLTPRATAIDEQTGGKLLQLLKGGAGIKKGTARVFSNIHHDFISVAVAGLGEEGVGYSEAESLDMCKENIRWAAGIGAYALQEEGISTVYVEEFTNTEAAAEGAALAIWKFQPYKSKEEQIVVPKLELFEGTDREGWHRGMLKADSQNIARRLEETPANLMTPMMFAQNALDTLCSCGVDVELRERDWIETKKMNAFLMMARGSCEEPIVLELSYCGSTTDDKPVMFIAKGITFDSGGTCLKNCLGMSEYRGDMAGAAVVVAIFKCIAQMSLPINVRAIIPLCENMVGGMAVRPGDVVTAGNGKTIQIEDTDNEGRIILLDSLNYANVYHPCLVSTIATLTPGIRSGLGGSASGVFSTSDAVWRELNRAGSETGDRVWRFPFWKYYSNLVTNYVDVDVNNVGMGGGGGPCLGAAFLLEFAPSVDFLHLDITGTGLISNGVGYPYLKKGLMSGRPVRTLVQFLYQLACPHDKGEEC